MYMCWRRTLDESNDGDLHLHANSDAPVREQARCCTELPVAHFSPHIASKFQTLLTEA